MRKSPRFAAVHLAILHIASFSWMAAFSFPRPRCKWVFTVPTGHFAACDPCAEALVEALMREPAPAQVSAGFAARVSAKARRRSIDPENVLPFSAAAASLLFAALSAFVLWTGTGIRWLEDPPTRQVVWLAAGAVETAICFLFLWRTARTY